MAKEPRIKSVKFKNPTTKSIEIAGRVISEHELTPELYIKLVQLNQSYADQFELEFENVKIETIKETENGKEEVK